MTGRQRSALQSASPTDDTVPPETPGLDPARPRVDSVENRSGPAAGRLLRSTIFSGLTSFADLLLLVLLILAGRLLGAEDFGRLAFGLAMSTVLVFFVNLGLDSVSTRRIAVNRRDASAVVGSVLAGKLTITLLAFVLYVLIVRLTIADPLTRSVTYLLGFAGLVRAANLTLRAFLHGQERFSAESAVVLTERMLVLTIGAALLFGTGDLLSFVLAFSIARILGFGLLLAQVHKHVPWPTWTIDGRLLKSMLRQGLPLGIAFLTYGLYNQIDVLLLTAMLPPEDVGEFASAYRLYEGLLIVPSVLTIVVYPRLAVLIAENEEKFDDLLVRAIKYVMVLAVPLVVIGTMLSEQIIAAFYGGDFSAGADVLSLLSVALGFFFIHAIVDTALRARALERAVLRVNLTSLAAKAALGLLLIPQIGIRGAAFAGIGGSIVMLVTGLTALGWRSLSLRRIAPIVGKAAAGAAAMGACIVYASAHDPSLLWALCSAGLVYAAVMLAARILDHDEWSAVRTLLPMPIQRKS